MIPRDFTRSPSDRRYTLGSPEQAIDMSVQTQTAHQSVTSLIQPPRQAAVAIGGQNPDVGAIQPGASRIVMAEPVVVHRLNVAMLEVHQIDGAGAKIGRAGHDTTSGVFHYRQLPWREASDVLRILCCSNAFRR
jgi:hypothetical protein